MITPEIVLILSFAGCAFCLFMIRRNDRVYHYRLYLIEQLYLCAQADIAEYRDYQWRRAAFNAVSYKRMLYEFWRRPADFYPNKDFLDATVQRGEL